MLAEFAGCLSLRTSFQAKGNITVGSCAKVVCMLVISFVDSVPDVVVGEIVLGEGDVCGHHHPDPAGHDPVLVEDDAGGHHQARVREEPRVVDVEQFPCTVIFSCSSRCDSIL